MRKVLIAANWKMYKTPAEAKAFTDAFLPLVKGHTRDEIALFPSTTSLATVIEAAKGSNVSVGCQNIHFAEEGAYTGETSANMLIAVGGARTPSSDTPNARQYFAETDEIVNKKLHTALKHALVPIVCIGEVLAGARSRKDRGGPPHPDHRSLRRHHPGDRRSHRDRLRAGVGHRHR